MDRLTESGVVLTTVTVLCTARVVYEQTLLAWTPGAPSDGFSWSPLILDFIGLLCVIAGLLWPLGVVVSASIERVRISPTNRCLIVLVLTCRGLWWVSDEEWKLLMIRVHGAEHAPKSWIVRSAAGGIKLLNDLIAAGADVNTRTRSGESPLGAAAAAAAGATDAARMLIAHGARLENRTLDTLETPLTEAAQNGNAEMVRLLRTGRPLSQTREGPR